MADQLSLPVLPLRDAVLFPGIALPLSITRASTRRAIDAALRHHDSQALVLLQKRPVDRVTPADLNTVGTIARVGQVQRHLAAMQVMLQGERRGVAVRLQEHEGYLLATVLPASDKQPAEPESPAFVALHEEARLRATELARGVKLPEELVQQVLAVSDQPGRLADIAAALLEVTPAEKQRLLEAFAVEDRLRLLLLHVERQLAVLGAKLDIRSKVMEELGERQREMVLREQLKAIQEELGEGEEVDLLAERLAALDLPPEVRREVDRELSRLRRTSREAMEAQVIRTFLEVMEELPWSRRSEDHLEIREAREILDQDHYGLAAVKQRVLEFLAVRKLQLDKAHRNQAAVSGAGGGDAGQVEGEDEAPAQGTTAEAVSSRGPILLFTGPPGVGKTSIARSIARAMGRRYVRISLGGARDEADIRGHRRTYVGAMPGRILQGMRQVGSRNPVFLLDEIDKIGASFQGDPASALLEALDPAQNHEFVDHYLGVPFDLSEVLFIATANATQPIPGPLLDRMEAIEFAGYTEAEKREIARRYLLPRQLEENALEPEQLSLGDEALAQIIARYTREAGVRQLERELGKLCRRVALEVASGEAETLEVTAERLRELLGRPRVRPQEALTADEVGVATGMFYTPAGGDILLVEASLAPGDGELQLTGKLGEVMQESARAAWSWARAHAELLGIPSEAFRRDLHVHVPAGAIPKDGPSAGVALATAIVSALCARPVRHDLAMTGEITLTGRILPVGGIKEKILGAERAGIAEILLPQANEGDLEELPEETRERVRWHSIERLEEALALALRPAGAQNLVAPETPARTMPS